MRIGIFFPTKEHAPLDETVARLVEVAGHGYSSVWLPQSSGFDALTVLALVGRETGQASGRVELGTSVVPTYPRHPVALAAQALTANAASGARLVLGIGLSHRVTIEHTYGLSYDRPARHMREYLDALVPLLRDGVVDVDGETVSARAAPHRARRDRADVAPGGVAAADARAGRRDGRRHDHVVHGPGHPRAPGGAAPACRRTRRRDGLTRVSWSRSRPSSPTTKPTVVPSRASSWQGTATCPSTAPCSTRRAPTAPPMSPSSATKPPSPRTSSASAAVGATDFVAIPTGTDADRRRTLDHLATLVG